MGLPVKLIIVVQCWMFFFFFFFGREKQEAHMGCQAGCV